MCYVEYPTFVIKEHVCLFICLFIFIFIFIFLTICNSYLTDHLVHRMG